MQALVTAPISVKIDESSAPRDTFEVAPLQLGGLHCAWGGDTRTDAMWDDGLEFWFHPDAQAEYDAYSASANDSWSGDFRISTVPGGSWAFAPIAAAPPLPTLVETLAAVPTAGADAAYIGCEHCIAMLSIGGSYVQLTLDSTLDREAWAAMVASYISSIPKD